MMIRIINDRVKVRLKLRVRELRLETILEKFRIRQRISIMINLKLN